MAQEDVPSGMAPKSDPGDGEESEWVAASEAFRDEHPDLADLTDDELVHAMAVDVQLAVGPDVLADPILLPQPDTDEEEVPPLPDDIQAKRDRIAAKWQARNKKLWDEEIRHYPAVRDMMAAEEQREKDLAPIRAAFVKAQQKKQK